MSPLPSSSPTPLKFLGLGWFAMVMGLAGLSLAWLRAAPRMGEVAGAAGMALGAVAALAFVLLGALSLWRWHRHPQALAEELRHPMRQAFLATVPVSALLLATIAQALAGAGDTATSLLWMAGAASEFAVTVWILSRWLRADGGLPWAAVTPVLIIPVVGNVVPPLAGVALGWPGWSAAQFGIGLFFWPVLLALLAVRLGLQGLWSERLLATTFITIAPPAVIGASALALGAPVTIGWMCWGVAAFFLAWSATLVPRLRAQPFSMTAWSVSFPLTAFTGLGLRLADAPGTPAAFGAAALAVLAATTLVISALALATLRGLRQGTLLAPEPVAMIQPAAVPPAAAGH